MKAAFSPAILCFLSLLAAAGCATRTRTATTSATPPVTSARRTVASAASPIAASNWTTPEPGWLYLLDPEPMPDRFAGRIWLLDPGTGKVMGAINTGPDPDFALSPDGASLYVASKRNDQQSDLAVIKTATGEVLKTGTVENRVVATGTPPYSSMGVSGDGLALRILVDVAKAPDTEGFQLATYDARSAGLLPGHVHLGNCGYGRFIDYATANEFDYLCPATNRIRHIRVDAESHEIDNSFVVLPWVRRLGVAQAFLAPEGRDMTVVRGDGAVYSMDVRTTTFGETPVQGDVQGRILPAVWPLSPDGSRLYLGYSRSPNNRFYLDYDRSAALNPRRQSVDEIRVFDTKTWDRIGNIKTSAPLWTAVTANNGRLLYALSPESHSVLVIDTTTMRETRAMPVGGMPALALVAR